MGKSSPSPPSAAQQGAVNVDTAMTQQFMNMVDQSSPFGNVQYTPTGETMTVGTGKNIRTVPRYSQTVSLDPSQQRQLDARNEMNEGVLGVGNQMVDNIGQQIQTPFNPQGLPGLTQDYSGDRQRIEDSIYGRQATRLDDRFGRQEQQLKTELMNRGLREGTEAWTNAMKDFNYGRNDAYQGASAQAIGMGGEEQARLDAMARGARQQGFTEESYKRSLPTNELAALLGFNSGVQAPQFSAPPQTGVANTTLQQKPGTDYSTTNSLIGGGASILAAMLSDARMKEDIVHVGNLYNGLPVYLFRYKGGDKFQIGLMAQDVERVNPAAVIEHEGIKYVNYMEAVQ
jgi:hypothetical protein